MTGFLHRFFKKHPTDRTKEYWAEAAKGPLEKTIEKICDGFDRETFATKKDSILFFLDIPLLPEFVVLDLACGIGRTCKWVSPKVKQYVGVDFIPDMIEKAKEYNKQYPN
ncbi:MAG: methyltransferase domain-containing protein, partial [Thaumarchaeota archaeon]|nr:methyltransferase domain-containing protein [Nitrososphaerota archaeon]